MKISNQFMPGEFGQRRHPRLGFFSVSPRGRLLAREPSVLWPGGSHLSYLHQFWKSVTIPPRKRPPGTEALSGNGLSFSGRTESIPELSFSNTPASSPNRQPDTLMSSCGPSRASLSQITWNRVLAKDGAIPRTARQAIEIPVGIKGDRSSQDKSDERAVAPWFKRIINK